MDVLGIMSSSDDDDGLFGKKLETVANAKPAQQKEKPNIFGSDYDSDNLFIKTKAEEKKEEAKVEEPEKEVEKEIEVERPPVVKEEV